MRKNFFITMTVIASFSVSMAHAAPATHGAAETVHGLLQQASSRRIITNMIRDAHFPDWILRGNDESPGLTVVMGERRVTVFTLCKPHDCIENRVAMAYDKDSQQIAAVSSRRDASVKHETLIWYGLSTFDDVETPAVLYAALTGSLSNHPQRFNVPDARDSGRK